MEKGDSFSISFHQGVVDFPYNLKIQVSKIDNDTSGKHSYRFIGLNKDNHGNPNIKFVTAFFEALAYLQNDANFSAIKFEYRLPDENQEEIHFERIAHIDNPIFDSMIVTGYIGKYSAIITGVSCPPQREA